MTDVPTLTSGKRGPTRTKAKKPPTKSASLVCSHLDCAQELPRHHFWKNGVSDDHLEDEENPICVASRWDEELKSMEGLSENDQWNVLHKYIQQYRDWQESFPRRNKRLSQAETKAFRVLMKHETFAGVVHQIPDWEWKDILDWFEDGRPLQWSPSGKRKIQEKPAADQSRRQEGRTATQKPPKKVDLHQTEEWTSAPNSRKRCSSQSQASEGSLKRSRLSNQTEAQHDGIDALGTPESAGSEPGQSGTGGTNLQRDKGKRPVHPRRFSGSGPAQLHGAFQGSAGVERTPAQHGFAPDSREHVMQDFTTHETGGASSLAGQDEPHDPHHDDIRNRSVTFGRVPPEANMINSYQVELLQYASDIENTADHLVDDIRHCADSRNSEFTRLVAMQIGRKMPEVERFAAMVGHLREALNNSEV